ncbi:hypothetical protein L3Y34_019947 [Caenorhabditis briggsae]|uniref:DUF6570 domain-containing protein n=1 Tax=Caenorhabditis briggsae TaxID=6238 RepID=A0AAE9IXE5_CAEBR|nr:hypothetical protein L3Y34_019947 [Caenorhabditis briggsae]
MLLLNKSIMNQFDLKAIIFDDEDWKRTESDAVLILCNKSMTEFYGEYSESVHNSCGPAFATALVRLKEESLVGHELQRGQVVFVKATPGTADGISRKLIIFGRFDDVEKLRLVDEEALRLIYIYSFLFAQMHDCQSITIPTVNRSNYFYKNYCRMIFQSVGIFMKMNPATNLASFSVVVYSDYEYKYFSRKMGGKLGVPMNHSFFMLLKKDVERHTVEKFKFKSASGQTHRFYNHISMRQKLTVIGIYRALRKAKALSDASWKTFVNFRMQNSIEKYTMCGGHLTDEEDNVTGSQSTNLSETTTTSQLSLARQSLKRKTDARKRGSVAKWSSHRNDSLSTQDSTPGRPSNSGKRLRVESSSSSLPSNAFSPENDIQEPANEELNYQTPKTKAVMKRKDSSSIKMKLKRARAVREAKNTESYTFDPTNDANFTEMMSSVRAIQNFIHGEINTAQTQIKSQLEVNVCGPKEMSNKEMQKRRLCRIPIHIYDPDVKDGKKYDRIRTVYEDIWREFMGYDAPRTVVGTNVEKVRNEEEYMEVDEEEGTPEIAPPPRQMEVSLGNTGDGDIDEMLAEIYGPQIIAEMDNDNDGGYTRDLVTYYTRARACDTDCPKMDIEEAAAVCERIRDHQRLVEGTVADFTLDNLLYTWREEERFVLDWLQRFANCYQGVRSILKRYTELRRLYEVASECEEAIELGSVEGIKNLLKLDGLTENQRSIFFRDYASRVPQDMHQTTAVQSKYGAHLDQFNAAMADGEVNTCDVCGCLTLRSRLNEYSHLSKYMGYLDDEMQKEVMERFGQNIDVCEICRKSNGSPDAAVSNSFQPQDAPPVIADLNVLEKMLIQRTRANQKIFFLRSITNKKTPMKATRGVLVVLPTEIEPTVDHVLDVLPSGASLNIQVRTGWEKSYIVSMTKVLAALKWLKENNPLYHDVEINEDFNFKIGEDINFEKAGATQADADALICRDDRVPTGRKNDGHLLTQDVVELQPVHRMHQKNDNLTPYEKFTLQKQKEQINCLMKTGN